VSFTPRNHPQQVLINGARDDVDSRGTPLEVFSPIDHRYRFTIDVAADENNTKCERFYDREADGLAQDWAGERVWCNPPYSDIRPWVEKAWSEWRSLTPPECIVFLLPANRTEQRWWQDLVEPFRDHVDNELFVVFLRGRIGFLQPSGEMIKGPKGVSPPFGCCLLVWRHW